MELEARRIAQLAQQAIERVDDTRRAAEDALAALNGVRARSAARVVPAAPPEGEPAPSAEASIDAARLVAIEMAVAGSSREEVGSHLQAAYAPADLEALLDDVFGGADDGRGASSL